MALSGFSRQNDRTTVKIGCRQQTLFFMLEWATFVPKMPKPHKCLKEGCSSTHNTLPYGSEKSFPQKCLKKTDKTKENTASIATFVANKAEESPGVPSVTNFMGLLPITEVNLQSCFHTEKLFLLCDSACNNSWVSENWLDN